MNEGIYLLGGAVGILIVVYVFSRLLRARKHGFSIRLQLFLVLFFSSLVTTGLIGFWAIDRIEAKAAQLFDQKGLSTEVFQHFINEFGLKTSLIFGTLGLLAAGSAYILGKWIANPLEQLTQAAQAVAVHQDDEFEFPPPQGKEVRQLTHSLQVMHQSLAERQQFERFIADLSHDLKNPVSAVRASCEVLLEGADQEPELRTRFLLRIEEATRRLDRLLSDFLSLARLEAREMTPDPRPVSLIELTQSCLRSFEGVAESKNVHFVFTLDLSSVDGPQASKVIALQEVIDSNLLHSFSLPSGNRLWLSRAIDNLLSNALRYSPQSGSIYITLSVGTSDHPQSPSSSLIISIEDEGPGVDVSLRDSLFERFISDYPNPLRKTGGSGLGLAIVQRVALAHHGDIRLLSSSQSINGAHFELSLSAL